MSYTACAEGLVYIYIYIYMYIWGILRSSKSGVGNNSLWTKKLFKFQILYIPDKELNVNKFRVNDIISRKKQYSVTLG